MNIKKAKTENFEDVKLITHETIKEIYPHYYPRGVVDFFLEHHNSENITKDILADIVYLIMDGEETLGTVTIKENEICRLFVLPQHQRKGVGKQLLDFAEKKIADKYADIILDSSLPAKDIYRKRGYIIIESHKIVTANEDVLCYDLMKKNTKA
ncbi:MAG: GNAT family N-acetyltransferase [Lachnospiraceae bacterium]|nr:GNAT family N-acetyltransferase [Lachnospiraceae bacterium]